MKNIEVQYTKNKKVLIAMKLELIYIFNELKFDNMNKSIFSSFMVLEFYYGGY